MRAGPDVDTDAYAHQMIARAILADPRDLAVHWVWLPLFHYAQVPLVALGASLDTVRWGNVALAAALPAVLYAYVRRTARSGESRVVAEGTALLAALIAAACPIAMQIGTTAQPEPLFALLVLGTAIAVEQDRPGWTAALLGAAVMLRYEAWAALAAVALVAALKAYTCGWLGVAVPAALILGWAALRRPVDGVWFGFLGQTKAFANEALHQRRGVLRDLLYYPAYVPLRVLGAAMIPVPLGVMRTIRQQGGRFVLVLTACLGFVSLTWVMRSSLGLDRHFVCVVPLYATFAAQGTVVLADAVARWSGRAQAGRVAGAVLGVGMLAGLLVQLDVWMGYWRDSIARGWPPRVGLARYLEGLPEGTEIYCDDATIEALDRASIGGASTGTPGSTTPPRGASSVPTPSSAARWWWRRGGAS